VENNDFVYEQDADAVQGSFYYDDDPEPQSPSEQQSFDHQPQYAAPAYQQQQQQIDPEQYNAALDALQRYEAYAADRQAWDEEQDRQQRARQAQAELAKSEFALQMSLAKKRKDAEEMAEYDPKGAVALMEQAALEERRHRQGQFARAIEAAGRAQIEVERRYLQPQIATGYAQAYGLDEQAAHVLMNLPQDQIPVIAEMMGTTTQQLVETQNRLQMIERRQQQQAQRQNVAHTAPGTYEPQSARGVQDGSREQLRGALRALFPDMYAGG
jgi:hypothetical protein